MGPRSVWSIPQALTSSEPGPPSPAPPEPLSPPGGSAGLGAVRAAGSGASFPGVRQGRPEPCPLPSTSPTPHWRGGGRGRGSYSFTSCSSSCKKLEQQEREREGARTRRSGRGGWGGEGVGGERPRAVPALSPRLCCADRGPPRRESGSRSAAGPGAGSPAGRGCPRGEGRYREGRYRVIPGGGVKEPARGLSSTRHAVSLTPEPALLQARL